MKYGAHTYLFTDRWSDACLPILDRMRDLGMACAEIAVGDDVSFTPAMTRRRAGSLGLELVVSPGGRWPLECDLSSDDPGERRLGLEWHKRQVDLGGEVGATAYTGCLYGHAGVVRRRRMPPDEYPRTAEGLHALAEHGRKRGLHVVLEPMSHFRTHVVNNPDQLVRLVGLAGHGNLRCLLDTYHLITEVRDYGQAIRTVGTRLWGLHACESDRGVPGGGLVPWPAVFAALRDIAFDGVVMFEAYNSSLGDFAFERMMFHDVCPDGAEFVRRGLAFLRDCEQAGRRGT